MKRGKRLSVSLDEQKSAFQEHKEKFLSLNTLPSSESHVYKDVSRKLSSRMTPKALYLSAKRNYVKFFGENSFVCDKKVPSLSEPTSNSTDNDLPNCFDSNDTQLNDNAHNTSTESDDENNKVIESFYVSDECWQDVKPKLVIYKRNDPDKPSIHTHTRKLLPKSKWTNIFSEWIWVYTNNRCVWCFKHNHVSDDYSVKCTGKCKECDGELTLVTRKIGNSVKIDCAFQKVDKNVIHSKKNKLTSFRKKCLAQTLENQYPIVLRNKMLHESMKENCVQEPPFIPTLQSLHNIRNKAKYYHKIVVIALWIMSFTKPYESVVRSVSVVPFFVHYWTEMQQTFYKKMSKVFYTVLSIDATGSIFKKIYPPNDSTNSYDSKHLFLYVVMLKLKSTSVPVTQMISGSQKLDTIHQWLQSWIGAMQKPKEIICDDSAGLIGAIVKSFTKFSTTKEYINHCMKILDLSEKTPPDCLVRLDTSHFVKMLYALDCFRFVDKRVKRFYIKHLLRLKSCTNYLKAQEIIHQLVIVALHRYDRNLEDGTPTKCETVKEKLNQDDDKYDNILIENFEKDFSDLLLNSTSILLNEDSGNSSIISWYNHIVASEKVYSELCDETKYDNMYYLPGFIDSFKKILSKLPLWSNIMLPFVKKTVDEASSSNVESYFKTIKNLLIHNRNGLTRVDDFIAQHTEFVSGEIKSARCTYPDIFKNGDKCNETSEKINLNQKNIEDGESFYNESVFRKSPILQENWRGKAENKKSQPLRDVLQPKKRYDQIDFLPNGNISSSGITGVILRNTCAFDALIQGIVVTCVEKSRILMFINSQMSKFSQIVCAIRHKDYTFDIFKERTQLLRPFFKSTFQGNVESIDCSCNVTYILEKVLFNIIFSGKITKSCSECNHVLIRNCPIIPLNLLILTDRGLSALGDAALSMIGNSERDCKTDQCKGKQRTTFEISDYFIFFELDMDLSLIDIPEEIMLHDKIFALSAVIEFLPPAKSDDRGVGHYRVHCRRTSLIKCWECYDDMAKNVLKLKSDLIVVHSHLIMYIKSV